MIRKIEIDPRIRGKIADLFDPPVVIYLNKFNEDSLKEFSEEMNKAHETRQPLIPVVIDSYGGYVDTLIGYISEIQSAKVPIATICLSKAMSAGGILLGFGTPGYRYVAPHARVMLHQVFSFTIGKIEDMKTDVAENDRLNAMMFKLLAKQCKKKDDYFLEILTKQKANKDWYLTAEEAKKHNLCDHVYTPKWSIKVNIDMKFE